MLVLTRKVGQAIVIGDNIHITVVDIRGGTVRIGIAAPAEVIVDREEIHAKRLNTIHECPDPNDWDAVRPSQTIALDRPCVVGNGTSNPVGEIGVVGLEAKERHLSPIEVLDLIDLGFLTGTFKSAGPAVAGHPAASP